MKTKPAIERLSDCQKVAERAHNIFFEAAQQSLTARGRFIFAISGGRTPFEFFEELGSSQVVAELDWNRIHVFWVDERCVSPDSDESNYHHAARLFLDKINIPSANIHRIRTEMPDAQAVAAEYQKELRDVFGIAPGQIPKFDLIVLGMGPDGHTGSLFSGSPAVVEINHLAVAAYFTDSRRNRITLTAPVLTAARRVAIIVTGSEKAEPLRDILTSEPDVITWPIHCLWPVMDRIIWLVDAEAARMLPDDITIEKIESR